MIPGRGLRPNRTPNDTGHFKWGRTLQADKNSQRCVKSTAIKHSEGVNYRIKTESSSLPWYALSQCRRGTRLAQLLRDSSPPVRLLSTRQVVVMSASRALRIISSSDVSQPNISSRNWTHLNKRKWSIQRSPQITNYFYNLHPTMPLTCTNY